MSETIRQQLSSRLPKADGVDHINVQIYTPKTELGKILHPEYRRRFFIPSYGEYLSAICFLRWVGGAGEEARFNAGVKGWNNIQCYKEAVVLAKFCQFKKLRPVIIKELNKYKVNVFISYKTHPSGVREVDYKWGWFIDILPELISQAVDPSTKYPNWTELGFAEDSLELIESEIKKYVVSKYEDAPVLDDDEEIAEPVYVNDGIPEENPEDVADAPDPVDPNEVPFGGGEPGTQEEQPV